MTSILKQRDTSMTDLVSPPMTVTRVTPLAQRLALADQSVFLGRFLALSNATFLLILVYLFLVPAAPLGILRFAQEAFALPREVAIAALMGLFFMDISQAVRDMKPSWAYLTSLTGQGALALIALVYGLRGEVSIIGMSAHIGPFVLSVMAVSVFAQRVRPIRFLNHIKLALLPVISLIMMCLSYGLLVNQDAPTRQFIEDRYGIVALAVIVPLLWWGAGQLRHNHIEPWKAVRRMGGLYFFALMTLYLLSYGSGASLMGVFMTLHLCFVTVVIAFIQAREWAG